MMVKKVLYFMFIGVFKTIWAFLTSAESSAGSGGALKGDQALFALTFLIVILFVVVGNGALALVGVGAINLVLCSWLCRKGPDRRYTRRMLKKHGVEKRALRV